MTDHTNAAGHTDVRSEQTSEADNAVTRLLLSHRSIRSYTDEPVSRSLIDQAVRAGQAAATSSAVQAYGCLRVTDASQRAELAELTGPQEKVRTAPEFFVICADSRRHRLLCDRAGSAYDQRLEAFMVAVIDATLFAQNMVAALESFGLGTCYIGGLRNHLDRVLDVIKAPRGVYPVFGLCVGWPAEQPSLRPRLPMQSVLHDGAFPGDDEVLAEIDAYDETYRAYLSERGAPDEQARAGWGGAMAAKQARVSRPRLSGAYRRQGAVLD